MRSAPASSSQLTLSLEPSLPERWRTLREFIAYRVNCQAKPAKSIAADMELSPSGLSRKLHPGETDTARFNVDDLEAYLHATDDVEAIIEYLASKYRRGGDEERRARLMTQAEAASRELSRIVGELKAVRG